MNHHLNNILKYEVRKLCKGWVDSNKKEKEDNSNITDNYDIIKKKNYSNEQRNITAGGTWGIKSTEHTNSNFLDWKR